MGRLNLPCLGEMSPTINEIHPSNRPRCRTGLPSCCFCLGAQGDREGGGRGQSHRNADSAASSVGFAAGLEGHAMSINLASVRRWRSWPHEFMHAYEPRRVRPP